MKTEFKITKEQIIELSKNDAIHYRLRKWFPDAFKTELELGKWYKQDTKYCDWLMNYQGTENVSYGFNTVKNYSNEYVMVNSPEWIEATEKEVFEALKNEAVKRGFVKGALFQSIDYDTNEIFEIESVDFCFNNNSMHLRTKSEMYTYRDIFSEGKWALIIPKITKQEAEKKLNCKIV